MRSEVAPWLWLLPESRWHSAVPAVWALAVDSPPPNPPSLDSCVRQFEKVLDLGSKSGREDSLSLRCSFASFNVTTLRPAKEGLVVAQAATRERGVQALLQQQFHTKRLLFVGLQETRVPASAAYASGSYIVLSASADETGQGGVALWISTQLPYATDGRGNEFYFQKKHCVVLFADPRSLYVKVCAPGINLLLCVWHAPHSMRPADERTRWWQEAERLLCSFAKSDDEVLLLMDANARVGSMPCQAIGSVGAEKETPNGTLLREFLESWRLFLPATAPVHTGQDWTWTSPRGTHARIDYVAVPQAWAPTVVASSVLVDIEHAQMRDDHVPVVVSIEAIKPYVHAFDGGAGRKEPDLRLSSVWSQGLATGRMEPWHTSVDDHAFRVLCTHQRLMTRCAQPKVSRPRQPFLSELTLQLVHFRKHLRHSTRQLSDACRLQELQGLFKIWQGSVHRRRESPSCTLREEAHLHRRLACAIRALQLSAREIHQLIRADKAEYLRSLAKRFQYAAERGDVQSLYRALSCFRPNGGKRRRLHPLEGVQGPEGQSLGTHAEVARRWSQHFGQIEGGQVGSVRALAESYLEAHALPVEPPLLEDLPSLQDWEATFSGLHSKKSPGPGGLSAAFVNQDRPAMAAHTFTLCLKTAHQGREPLLWRGGRAFALYKGKGDARLCQSFRSILLSDLLAKRWHKLLRNLALPAFEEDRSAGQSGVSGGATTSLLSLWVRACQNYLSNRSISHGFLFTDVRNAFYTVLRQFLMDRPDPDTFTAWARTVGMGEDHLDLIASMLLQEQSAFPPHLPSFLKARIQDTLSHTWFVTTGDDSPVLTSKGTRPGDPLADLMFAFVLKGVLTECNSAIEEAGLNFCVDTAGVLPSGTPGSYAIESSMSWHDDCAFVFVARSSRGLREAASHTLYSVEKAFSARGLALSFAAGKTELLLHPLGGGHQLVRQQLFTASEPQVCFLPEVGSLTWVRLVRGYTHLGSAVDVTGNVAKDIQRRLSHAREAARPLRKHVFGCPQVPLPTRAMLFRSLVMSRLLHNVGSWVRLTQTNRQSWQGGCISLYRQLLTGQDVTAFFHNHDLCHKLRLPPPLALLRFERLRLFALVACRGSVDLLRVLEAGIGDSGCWLSAVSEDIQWLGGLRQTPDTATLCRMDISEAFLHCRQRPTLMRSLLRAAWHIAAVDCQSQDFERLAIRVQAPHTCRMCGTVCASKRGLHAHLAAKHALRLRGRFYAKGRVCQCCSKLFSHREKLIKHLVRGSPQCLSWLRLHVQPLTMEEEATLSRSKDPAGAGTGALVRAYVGQGVPVEILSPDTVEPQCIEDYL